MSFVTAALIVGGGMAVAGGLSYLGGQAQSDAASSAADSAALGTQSSIDAQERMFDKSVELQEPFRLAGLSVLPGAVSSAQAGQARIPGLLEEAYSTKDGLSPAEQWEMEQAQRSNRDALSARGLGGSGAALELNRRTSQSIAAQDYSTDWNRKLAATGLALGQFPLSTGSSAAANIGSAATSTGANIGSTYQSGANTQAGYQYAGGQAVGQSYQNMGGLGAGLGTGLARTASMSSSGIGASGVPAGSWNYGGDSWTGYYAEGGRPEPGQPAVVGEQGPEVFVPDQPGTIVPNPQTQARQAGQPGAGLNMSSLSGGMPEWMQYEQMGAEELKAELRKIDSAIQKGVRVVGLESDGMDYYKKRDALQKLLSGQAKRVASIGGK
jgi:hypothetical protein